MAFTDFLFGPLSKQASLFRLNRLSYFWFLTMNFVEAIILQEIHRCLIVFTLTLFHCVSFLLKHKFSKKKLHLIEECLFLIGYISVLALFCWRIEDGHDWKSDFFFMLFNVIYGQIVVFQVLNYKLTKFFLVSSFLVVVVWKIDIEIYYKFFLLISTFLSFRSKYNQIDGYFNYLAYESDHHVIFPDNQDIIFEINKNLNFRSAVGRIYLENLLKDINQSKQNFISSLKQRNVILKGIFPYIPKKGNELHIKIESDDKPNNYNEEVSVENLLRKLFSLKEKEYFYITETTSSEHQIKSVLFLKADQKVYVKLKFETFMAKERENSEREEHYSKTIFFIAHELRTPLNCIMNSLQLLKEIVNTDERHHNFITPALISSKFMINLINNYLDVSQIQTDSLVLTPVEFDVCELIEETKELLSFQAKQRGIELGLIVDPSVRKVKNDKERIRQIIINLLSN